MATAPHLSAETASRAREEARDQGDPPSETLDLLSGAAEEMHDVRERQARAFSQIEERLHDRGGWDKDAADALMRIYEDEPRMGVRDPRPQLRDSDLGYDSSVGDLAARTEDLAASITRSLADILQKPHGAVARLAQQVGELERDIAAALEDVVRKADLESLKLMGANVQALAGNVDRVQAEVARLDGMDRTITYVMEQVSDERLKALLAKTGTTAAELEAVATMAADRTRSRLADDITRAMSAQATQHDDLRALIEQSIITWRNEASAQSAAEPERYLELKSLIETAEDVRRRQDQQTMQTLETVQDALVRVLDRMDSIELSLQGKATAEEAARPVVAPVAPETPFIPALLSTPPTKNQAAEQPAAAERTEGAQMVKRDLAMEAQRAKLKAAAARANQPAALRTGVMGPADAAVEGAQVDRSASQRAVPQTEHASAQNRLITPKRLAAMLAVIVAINGALLMLPRRSPEPPAIAIEPSPMLLDEPSLARDGAIPGNVEAPAEKSRNENGGSDSQAPVQTGPRSETAPSHLSPAIPNGETAPVQFGMQLDDAPFGAIERSDIDRSALPDGMTVEIKAQSDDALVHAYSEQIAAGLSEHLGIAAAQASPGALMPEERERLAANDTEPSRNSSLTEPATGAGRATKLELPPATVGPLSMRLAAANGDPSAEFEVGSRLAEGKGTEQNFQDSVRWYQRAAAQGFTQAHYRLGTLFERGLGVKKDVGRARVWYQRAAENGNVKAMHNLAVLIAGPDAVGPDYAAAAKWFQNAAEHGLPDSQFNLAVLYEHGLGVDQSRAQAYKWYALAAKGGDKDSQQRQAQLLALMAPAERTEAEDLVRNFKAKPADAMANDPKVAGEAWKKRAIPADATEPNEQTSAAGGQEASVLAPLSVD